eukprot:scaffold46553_cov43-Phaeocystis_antarctica.AAC.2
MLGYSIAPRCIAKMHRVRVWVGPGLGLAPQQRHLHREDALRRPRLVRVRVGVKVRVRVRVRVRVKGEGEGEGQGQG